MPGLSGTLSGHVLDLLMSPQNYPKIVRTVRPLSDQVTARQSGSNMAGQSGHLQILLLQYTVLAAEAAYDLA